MKKNILDTLIFLLLGGLSSLSLPPFNFFFINFLTLSIFFFLIFKKLDLKLNKKFFFYYGWLFGFGYFSTNLNWVTISLTFDQNFNFLIPIALVLIPAFLALFYGSATLIFYLFKIKNLISSFFLFSLLFGLVEFLRGNILTGFPWNLIIYSLSEKLGFVGIISIIGTYSLNLFLFSFYSAPAIYFLKKSKKDILICFFILLMPILFMLFSSHNKKFFLDSDIIENPYVVRVIGSNISLDRFYKNVNAEKVISELINISSPVKEKNIFFLWPEGIIPNTNQDDLYLYEDLFKKDFHKNHLIGLGITSKLSNENDEKFFNSFSIFDNKLNLVESYSKINLVPFGEFLPLEDILDKFGFKTITNKISSFSSGSEREIITIKNKFGELKFLPLICYEIIYSGNLYKNYNFDFIINISEDGWFGKSIGPKQHFVHSKFRAIETGKYVLRSSNNGMAAIINPIGEIEEKIDYGEDGYLDFDKRRVLKSTLFSIYGNKIFIFIILLYISLIFSFNRNKNE